MPPSFHRQTSLTVAHGSQACHLFEFVFVHECVRYTVKLHLLAHNRSLPKHTHITKTRSQTQMTRTSRVNVVNQPHREPGVELLWREGAVVFPCGDELLL